VGGSLRRWLASACQYRPISRQSVRSPVGPGAPDAQAPGGIKPFSADPYLPPAPNRPPAQPAARVLRYTFVAVSAPMAQAPVPKREQVPQPENPMKRMSIPHLVIAATLALLLPLEQAHCAWMGLQKQAAPVAVNSPAGHECCASPTTAGQESRSRPEQLPRGCACQQLPSMALPATLALGTEAPLVASLAVLTIPSIIAPVSIVTETVPALDVGSRPLPDDPGAHGLRAPPASA